MGGVGFMAWSDSNSYFILPTSDFRLPTSDFRLPTSDFRLQTSDFRLPTSDFPLPLPIGNGSNQPTVRLDGARSDRAASATASHVTAAIRDGIAVNTSKLAMVSK